MAKNQAKQEAPAEEPEVWLAEDGGDFDDAANDAVVPVKATRLDMRHKIEDLIETRRLRRQISDYDMLDIDDDGTRTRAPRRVH